MAKYEEAQKSIAEAKKTLEELCQEQSSILGKRTSEIKNDTNSPKLPRRTSRTPRKSANCKPTTSKTPKGKSFEVENIQAHKVIEGRRKYLVRWKNFSSDDDSWVWEQNLQCPKILEKYRETCGLASDSDS